MSYIDEYLAALDPERRAALEHIRALVHKLAPSATEVKSYNIPTFDYNGEHLLGFADAKDHMSLFPFGSAGVDAFREQLAEFSLSKGTIRFTVDHPIPDELLTQIITYRIQNVINT